jgi:hypothetical protein
MDSHEGALQLLWWATISSGSIECGRGGRSLDAMWLSQGDTPPLGYKMPNKEMLRSHLLMVERHVKRGLEMIKEQEERISRLQGGGVDAAGATNVLRQLLEIQELHEQHRDRLKRELGLIKPPEPS